VAKGSLEGRIGRLEFAGPTEVGRIAKAGAASVVWRAPGETTEDAIARGGDLVADKSRVVLVYGPLVDPPARRPRSEAESI
jgi:hypothetical protein